jgi:probable rRNA maturation factor
VLVSDGRGRPVRDGGLARWLAAVAPARVRGEVAVALVTEARIRKLNKQYRGKDAATDVLSFPGSGMWDPGSRVSSPEPRGPSPELGDIVIAVGVAKRQARGAGHSFQTELRVLALHGLLHLLGYDHEDRNDGGRMARAEARLRRKGGLTAGLIDRAAAPVRAGRGSRPRAARAGPGRRRLRPGSAAGHRR